MAAAGGKCNHCLRKNCRTSRCPGGFCPGLGFLAPVPPPLLPPPLACLRFCPAGEAPAACCCCCWLGLAAGCSSGFTASAAGPAGSAACCRCSSFGPAGTPASSFTAAAAGGACSCLGAACCSCFAAAGDSGSALTSSGAAPLSAAAADPAPPAALPEEAAEEGRRGLKKSCAEGFFTSLQHSGPCGGTAAGRGIGEYKACLPARQATATGHGGARGAALGLLAPPCRKCASARQRGRVPSCLPCLAWSTDAQPGLPDLEGGLVHLLRHREPAQVLAVVGCKQLLQPARRRGCRSKWCVAGRLKGRTR